MKLKNVTATFRDARVTTATLIIRKRRKKTQDLPSNEKSVLMTGPVGGKFSAKDVELPDPGANHKLLLRIVGANDDGTRIFAVIDAPPRKHPPT